MTSSSGKPPSSRDKPEAEASTISIPAKLIELAKKLQKLIDKHKQSDGTRQ
jgi:hypothetical protein